MRGSLSSRACVRMAMMVLMSALTVSAAWAAETRYRLDLPAGSLTSALQALAGQTGIRLFYVTDQLEGFRTGGVRGELTARAALERLLEGTQFQVTEHSSGTLLISQRQPSSAPAAQLEDALIGSDGNELEVVSVYGRGFESAAHDVPQAITVFGRQLLESSSPAAIRDVIRLVPSSALRQTLGSSTPELMNSRGFGTTFTIDGQRMPAISMLTPDAAGVERVEVLMGPASVQYGTMEPGAVINIVTKRPRRDGAHLSGSIEAGSYDRRRTTLDVGGQLGGRLRARLNVAHEIRETFYDHWRQERIFWMPVLEFDLTSKTMLTLEGWYQRREDVNGSDTASLPVAALFSTGPYGAVPERFSYAQPGVGNYVRREASVKLHVDHELGDAWQLSGTFNYDDSSRRGILWSGEFAGLQPDQRTVMRGILRQDQSQPTYIANVGLSGKFRTGAARHQLIAGIDWEECRFEGPQGDGIVDAIDLYEPRYPAVTIPPLRRMTAIEADDYGIYLQDRAQIGRLQATAGVRWTNIESRSAVAILPQPLPPLTGVEQDKFTTQFGLLYDLTDTVNVYASHVTSFVPRGGTTFGGSAFAPERSRQIEIGSKFRMGATGLTGAIALFNIEKPNVLVPDAANPGFSVPIARATANGVELSVSGRILPAWALQAAYGYLETESALGFALPAAPEHTFSAFSRYDFQGAALRGVGVWALVQYVDKVFPAASGGLQLPDFVQLDLGVRYDVTDRVQLSLNLTNVLDEDIYNSVSALHVARAEGRTLLAGMHFRL